MKYLILVCDGMADRKIKELGSRTPMEAANKPTMDALAKISLCGTVSNVPTGMVPESDTANLSILSYDPRLYSKGRSPLEAMSIGLDMQADETAYRCNLVTLSEEEDYPNKIMLDHSADEITTTEADQLIHALEAAFGNDMRHFYTGVSYRHCLLWKNSSDTFPFMRPHDILGQCIESYLPAGEAGEPFYRLMRESYDILNEHPVNIARREAGKRPANSIWLWSPGRKPALPSFTEKWGLRGAVISAVDLIKGIGICAGMTSIDVEGATGTVHTNYKGKAEAAIQAFDTGYDLVFVHVEGPDECGHRAEIENKVSAIEQIDQYILKPILEHLKESSEPFKIFVLPDHPTPIELRTHSMEPVPFFVFSSEKAVCGIDSFTEDEAQRTKLYYPDGSQLLNFIIEK